MRNLQRLKQARVARVESLAIEKCGHGETRGLAGGSIFRGANKPKRPELQGLSLHMLPQGGCSGVPLAHENNRWRRKWDSNPRYVKNVHGISNPAHSTTLPSLRSGDHSMLEFTLPSPHEQASRHHSPWRPSWSQSFGREWHRRSCPRPSGLRKMWL